MPGSPLHAALRRFMEQSHGPMDARMRKLAQKGKPESEQPSDAEPEADEIDAMLAEMQHGKGRPPPIEETPVGEEKYAQDAKEGEPDPSNSEVGHTEGEGATDTESDAHDQANGMGRMEKTSTVAAAIKAKKKGVRF